MKKFNEIKGVFAAAVTPLNHSLELDLENYPKFLDYLANRGCHGALLFGTTGEGPSFNFEERRQLMQVALDWRKSHPSFQLIAGVGTPSLSETIRLSRLSFELEMDAVLALPPYYFRNVTDDGLYFWYETILSKAVPQGSPFLGYHIPRVTGVPLSLDLLSRLKNNFPEKFAGIKDSSADLETTKALGSRFGKDLLVFNGTDPLFSTALEQNAAGCITALANVISPNLRKVWDAFQNGIQDKKSHERLCLVRSITDRFAPAPPTLKYLLSKGFDFPRWQVCPPLISLDAEREINLWEELNALAFDWRE